MTDTEKLSGAQALKRLIAIRALLPPDTPSICIYRRQRDRKIVHVSLQLGDMTWYYHRGTLSGSRLLLVPTAEYRGAYKWIGFSVELLRPTFCGEPSFHG